MDQITIRVFEPDGRVPCPVCGEPQNDVRGPRLFRQAEAAPLCRPCGRAAAPALTALLDLAQAAERVGQCNRRFLTPPMESLLDLARAAENYTHAAQAG
jgi:hypothetical protein